MAEGQNPTLVRACGSAREETSMLKSCPLSCKDGTGVGDLAQRLTALAAFAEDADQVPVHTHGDSQLCNSCPSESDTHTPSSDLNQERGFICVSVNMCLCTHKRKKFIHIK